MIEIIFQILVMLLGPVVITLPFLMLFLQGVVPNKKFWKYYIIIEVILTLIWSFVFLIATPNTPLHIDI